VRSQDGPRTLMVETREARAHHEEEILTASSAEKKKKSHDGPAVRNSAGALTYHSNARGLSGTRPVSALRYGGRVPTVLDARQYHDAAGLGNLRR